MKDIKYRAYIKKDYNKELVGKMLDVSSIHLKRKKIIIGYSLSNTNYGNRSYLYDDIELMQFTGLHDKNGKEIYEGDIVSKETFDDTKPNYRNISYAKVVWIEELASYHLVNKDDKILWDLASDKYNIEVAGNIYENGDLLKGADNID